METGSDRNTHTHTHTHKGNGLIVFLYSRLKKKDFYTFDPCDLKGLRIHKQNTIFVDGLELFHMHESRDYAMQLVEVAILVKITFLPIWPPTWPLTPNWSCDMCSFRCLLLSPNLVKIRCCMPEIWVLTEDERRKKSYRWKAQSKTRLCN